MIRVGRLYGEGVRKERQYEMCRERYHWRGKRGEFNGRSREEEREGVIKLEK
jgi:hypothetical protein